MRRFVGGLVLAALSLVACGGSGTDEGPVVAPVSSGVATPSVSAPEPSSAPEAPASAPSSEPGASEALDAASEIEAETGVRPPVVHPAMFADGAPKSLPEELAGFELEDPMYLPTSSSAEYYPAGNTSLDGFDLHIVVDDRRFRVFKDSSDITAEQHGLCGFRKNGLPHCAAFTEDGSVELVYFGDDGAMPFEELDGHVAEVLEYFRVS